MTERQRETTSATKSGLVRAAILALVAGCLSWTFVYPGNAVAQETSISLPTADVVDTPPHAIPAPPKRPSGLVRKATEKILADPVFGQNIEELSWRLRQQDKKAEEVPWWADYLSKIANFLAKGTRVLIYALIFLSSMVLLIVMYRYRYLALGLSLPAKKPLETLFGLDLRPASLPNDIASAALAELDAGRYAAALSLLYRGTLVTLIRRQHIEFRAGDTEDTCLHRVSGRIDAQSASYFAQLLDAWKRTAYAETPPDAASARDLCQRWALHFAEQSSIA